ncbi:MAG: hypothetical protein QXN36_04100 [Candidatus Bathyarchaeia archaeon]
MVAKTKLRKCDKTNILAFCLADIYGTNIPKRIWIPKEIREKASIIADKIENVII